MKIHLLLNPAETSNESENSALKSSQRVSEQFKIENLAKAKITHSREESEEAGPEKKRFKGTNQENDYITKLPSEVIDKIFSYLSLKERFNFGTTCKEANQELKENLKVLNSITFSPFHIPFELIKSFPTATTIKDLTLYFDVARPNKSIKNDLKALEYGFAKGKFNSLETLSINIDALQGDILRYNGANIIPPPGFLATVASGLTSILSHQTDTIKITTLNISDMTLNFLQEAPQDFFKNLTSIKAIHVTGSTFQFGITRILEQLRVGRLPNLEEIGGGKFLIQDNTLPHPLVSKLYDVLSSIDHKKKIKIDLLKDNSFYSVAQSSLLESLLKGENRYLHINDFTMLEMDQRQGRELLKSANQLKISSLAIFHNSLSIEEIGELAEKHGILKLRVGSLSDVIPFFSGAQKKGRKSIFELKTNTSWFPNKKITFNEASLKACIEKLGDLKNYFSLDLSVSWVGDALPKLLLELPLTSLTLHMNFPQLLKETHPVISDSVKQSFKDISGNSHIKKITFRVPSSFTANFPAKCLRLLKNSGITSSALYPVKVMLNDSIEIM
jgi:hypothetical protein